MGNELGAGRPRLAAYSTAVSLCITLVTTLCTGTLILTLRYGCNQSLLQPIAAEMHSCIVVVAAPVLCAGRAAELQVSCGVAHAWSQIMLCICAAAQQQRGCTVLVSLETLSCPIVALIKLS